MLKTIEELDRWLSFTIYCTKEKLLYIGVF